MNHQAFQELIWEKGRELYRPMPWREDPRPYYVLVSELMLQQTQVERVIPKFLAFIKAFPTVESLASARLADVLTLWSGLGYNRRAKFLHAAAQRIVEYHQGIIPQTREELEALPGIGKNTAGALLAYGFNQPVAFVETNIRTVYFEHFFAKQESVTDAEILALVIETVDQEHPREWYWALMDYGSFLKRSGAGALSKSKHYKKQSPLKGSLREMRGLILRTLTKRAYLRDELEHEIGDERFERALSDLQTEGLVQVTDGRLHLP